MTEQTDNLANLQLIVTHLQTGYRFWQRNKVEKFHGEIGSASVLLPRLRANWMEIDIIQNHIKAAKSYAQDESKKEFVIYELSKAVALSEKLIRRIS